MNSKSPLIPIVKPSQFDDYLFENWKAPVFDLYDTFHIERVENYKNHLILPTPPHRRSVNFILFLTKGMLLRTKGLSSYEICENQIFILPADQITAVLKVSEDAEGYYCHFSTEIMNYLPFKFDFQKTFPFFQIMTEPIFDVPDSHRIKHLYEILIQENQKNDSSRYHLLALYFYTLLSDLKLQISPKENATKNAAANLTQSYKNALSEFIYDKKSVAEYADYLSVSPNHLHKCVKATTGKSAHALLEEMRILEAKVLLRQTNLSIAEIAFKIGKFDHSDFSRFFKNHTNITPIQYRKDCF